MKEKLLRRKGVIFVLIAFIFMVPSIINAATLKTNLMFSTTSITM
ncbi:hypothetical protein [Anaerofustis stercorihominis]